MRLVSVVKLCEFQIPLLKRELLDLIAKYNQDPAWHGILVQLPLPKHIDEEAVLLAIDPEKDVDGFHPQTWDVSGLVIQS